MRTIEQIVDMTKSNFLPLHSVFIGQINGNFISKKVPTKTKQPL